MTTATYNPAELRDTKGRWTRGAKATVAGKITWKPVMTKAEADVWAKGSAYSKPVWHVTRERNVASIRQHGLEVRRGAEGFGHMWGEGIYLALDKKTARFYSKNAGPTIVRPDSGAMQPYSAVTLEARVNIKHPFIYDTRGKSGNLFDLVAQLPGGEKRFMTLAQKYGRVHDTHKQHADLQRKAFYAAKNQKMTDEQYQAILFANKDYHNNPEAFSLVQQLREGGYDALEIIDEPKVRGNPGGTQLMTPNPRSVTIVEKSMPDAVHTLIVFDPHDVVVVRQGDVITKSHDVRGEPRDFRGRWQKLGGKSLVRDMEYAHTLGALSNQDYHWLQGFLSDPNHSPIEEKEYHNELKGYIHEERERQRSLPKRLLQPIDNAAWFQRNPDFSSHWLDSLMPAEKQALAYFKSTQAGAMNSVLLYGDAYAPNKLSDEYRHFAYNPTKRRAELRQQNELAKQAVLKAKLPEKVVVYRGDSFADYPDNRKIPESFTNLKPGRIVRWHKFLSTSRSQDKARGFGGWKRNDYFWEIHIPKGHPAAPTDMLTFDRIAGSEQELTLPPGTRLRIRKMYHEAGHDRHIPKGTRIIAEALPYNEEVNKSFNPNEPRDTTGRWVGHATDTHVQIRSLEDVARENVARNKKARQVEVFYAPRINRLLGINKSYPVDGQEFLAAYKALPPDEQKQIDQLVQEKQQKKAPYLPAVAWDRPNTKTLMGIHFSDHTLTETNPDKQGSGQAGEERKHFRNGYDVAAGLNDDHIPYTNFYLADPDSPIEQQFLRKVAHITGSLPKDKIWDVRNGRIPYRKLQEWGYEGVFHPDGNQVHMFVPVKVRSLGKMNFPADVPARPYITGDMVLQLTKENKGG
jgi:hypothetical protein